MSHIEPVIGGIRMIVVGWNNGSPNNRTGAGYGIRIKREDRDRYFQRRWPFVTIEAGKGNIIKVNLSSSFWKGCTELRSAKIGKWMLDHGFCSMVKR